ncbi:hypothetical protein T05_5896 [Trichinella murrelli]|uniref:Uncharacterized protein n=1 Tax=Trichinella murrelli TaxID=144512 RepID=A0A0V0SQB1_9BILA|nr:hypothetical protein T05_5896 [Trichinella murrelli]
MQYLRKYIYMVWFVNGTENTSRFSDCPLRNVIFEGACIARYRYGRRD